MATSVDAALRRVSAEAAITTASVGATGVFSAGGCATAGPGGAVVNLKFIATSFAEGVAMTIDHDGVAVTDLKPEGQAFWGGPALIGGVQTAADAF